MHQDEALLIFLPPQRNHDKQMRACICTLCLSCQESCKAQQHDHTCQICLHTWKLGLGVTDFAVIAMCSCGCDHLQLDTYQVIFKDAYELEDATQQLQVIREIPMRLPCGVHECMVISRLKSKQVHAFRSL